MNEQQSRRRLGHGGWYFLAIVLLLYGVTALIDDAVVQKALNTFIHLLDQVFPALALVLVIIFVVDSFLQPGRVKKYLGQRSGLKGWLAALAGGILSAGPVYAWYALLSELRQKGMKNSLVAAFLYSRAIKLPMLPLLVHYFGLAYTSVLVIYLIVFAVASGLIMEKIAGPDAEAGIE